VRVFEDQAFRTYAHVLEFQQLSFRNVFGKLVLKELQVILVEVNRQRSVGT
jgi:hypothetical protein